MILPVKIIAPTLVPKLVTPLPSLPSPSTLVPVTSLPKDMTMAATSPLSTISTLSLPTVIAATPTVVQPANTPSTTVARVLTSPLPRIIGGQITTIPLPNSSASLPTLPNPNQSLPIVGDNQTTTTIPSTPDSTTYTEPAPRPTGMEARDAAFDPAGACTAIGGQYIDGVCYPPGLKPAEEKKDNTLLYVGIAAGSVAAIGLIFYMTRK